MIPASYLFKDIYRQTWLNPDIDCAKARHRAASRHRLLALRRGLASLLRRAADGLYRPQPEPDLLRGPLASNRN